MPVSYEANEWKDGASGGTPITADRLNHMEKGISDIAEYVSGDLNAPTATKLATARTIRTNLASTAAASFDGSANVTPGVTGTLPITNGGTGNTTGLAASATKLATARTIRTNLGSTNAASFDGSANVTPGVTGTLPVANGGTGVTTAAALALKAYPVGAVYISYVSTSPATLFGGTWTAITGRFPYFNAGTGTGGSNTHTLTAAQMPKHTHPLNVQNSSGSNVGVVVAASSGNNFVGGYIQENGDGGSHNNMPAYQTLYAWRRTA